MTAVATTGNNRKTNNFGGRLLVTTSPLSSSSHDPSLTLASNCILEFFGPTVQLVADALHSRGGTSTLAQLTTYLHVKLSTDPKQKWTEERRAMLRLNHQMSSQQVLQGHGPSRLLPPPGPCPPPAAVRAALLTLVQHSLVTVVVTQNSSSSSSSSSKRRRRHDLSKYAYRLDVDRARYLPRYAKFVEYVRDSKISSGGDNQAAEQLMQELLVKGRATTTDLVLAVTRGIFELPEKEEVNDDDNEHPRPQNAVALPDVERRAHLEVVLKCLVRLTQTLSFIERVKPIWEGDNMSKDQDGDIYEDQADDGEHEFDEPAPPLKRQKEGNGEDLVDFDDDDDNNEIVDDPSKASQKDANNNDNNRAALAKLLKYEEYRGLPPNAIWRVNIPMLHKQLRMKTLGNMVGDRFSHRVPYARFFVMAALKYSAQRGQSAPPNDSDSFQTFTAPDIVRFLPKPVKEACEKRKGGFILNLVTSLSELSVVSYPPVFEKLTVAPGQPEQVRFLIKTRQMVEYLQDCMVHQMILDSHGEVAARVCSILKDHSYLESDMIAEKAMVPAKDTREVCHRLYRNGYINLFNVNQGKQHNPASMIYVWEYSRNRIKRRVSEDVCTVLLNMRVRRQHEVFRGSEFMDRAARAGETDENENMVDQEQRQKFATGLERLDNAILQLDDASMKFLDYS